MGSKLQGDAGERAHGVVFGECGENASVYRGAHSLDERVVLVTAGDVLTAMHAVGAELTEENLETVLDEINTWLWGNFHDSLESYVEKVLRGAGEGEPGGRTVKELYAELWNRTDGRVAIWVDEDAREALRKAGIENPDEEQVSDLWFEIGDDLREAMIEKGWGVLDSAAQEMAARSTAGDW